ncbi:MAG: glycoside hydrolase family 9 protein [Polyangiaceae bacterium]|nr:glycoside hydrolase family 9 protein [Polyangiaceae bacterium]
MPNRRSTVLFLVLLSAGAVTACHGSSKREGTGGEAGSSAQDGIGGRQANGGAPGQAGEGTDGKRSTGGSGSTGGTTTKPIEDGGTVGTGTVTGVVRSDHFGWRPDDTKVAVLLDLAEESVELRSADDDSVVETFVSSASTSDEDSGDNASIVDFSAVTTPGNYYLHVPRTGDSSYPFRIADDVYDVVGAAAMKSFYFQRANHSKALPYASDELPGYKGLGHTWMDEGESHKTDYEAPPGPGSADNGALDVHGGWFDAGDYQKTLWGRGVTEMLWSCEVNARAWRDGQLNIPESGNGVADILDELRWELDFYVRMQRPDGHFMSSVKGKGGEVVSPPSASDEGRVYFDTTSPSGDGWSGGGVTLTRATGQAVLALAHAAIVYDAAGSSDAADQYRAAALDGWTWLEAQNATGGERRLKVAAAAAVHRLDSSQNSALAMVEDFPWATWDGALPYSASPADSELTEAAWHYLSDENADPDVRATVSEAVGDAIVDRAFGERGLYGGMLGGPGNAWDWSWGSNRNTSLYGANLMMAAHFGALGSHSEADVKTQAARYLHYMLGLNPVNMVYLTNMAAYGGEHSSFQIYHSWYSHSDELGEFGNPDYNGKPQSVVEPLYPYYPDDDQTSSNGPAPGLVPGGPNASYGGNYEIPNMEYPAYAYRDWSVGCDWDSSTSVCRSSSWEVTEPMCAYQGAFVLLVSFFMSEG